MKQYPPEFWVEKRDILIEEIEFKIKDIMIKYSMQISIRNKKHALRWFIAHNNAKY